MIRPTKYIGFAAVTLFAVMFAIMATGCAQPAGYVIQSLPPDTITYTSSVPDSGLTTWVEPNVAHPVVTMPNTMDPSTNLPSTTTTIPTTAVTSTVSVAPTTTIALPPTTAPGPSPTATSTTPQNTSGFEQQVVLAEIFTEESCTWCPPAVQALEKLAQEMGSAKLLVLEYHTGDAYSNFQTENRFMIYGARGTPTAAFNGANTIIGAPYNPYTDYRSRINSLLAARSPVSLESSVTNTDQMYINVSAANLGTNAINNTVMTAVIYQDIGTSEHHYVVRQMLSSFMLEPLQKSETQQFQFKYQNSHSYSPLKVVVFLQAQSGQILQSVLSQVQ